MHLQKKPYSEIKTVNVIKGKIFDVIVDLRSNSPTFKKWTSIEISAENKKMVYVPEDFAHGFQTLDKENIVCYSCTEYRSSGDEHALMYNDPQLRIKWFSNKPIMTKKDKNAKTLRELIHDKIVKI